MRWATDLVTMRCWAWEEGMRASASKSLRMASTLSGANCVLKESLPIGAPKTQVLELSVILDRNDFMAVKDINRDVRKMNNLSQVDHDRGVGWGYVTEKGTAQQASGVQIKFSRKYPELKNDTASLSRTWPRKDIGAVNLELARVQSRARKGNK